MDGLAFRLSTDNAYKEIASHLECGVGDVRGVFDWLPSPFYSRPDRVAQSRRARQKLRQMQTSLARFIKILETTDNKSFQFYLDTAPISANEFEQMYRWLSALTDLPENTPLLRSTKGGKNIAAYDVAGGIATLFERLQKPITFGHINGEPSTDFGIAVQVAFSAFNVKANWREPARTAAKIRTSKSDI